MPTGTEGTDAERFSAGQAASVHATGLGPDPDPAFVRQADLLRRYLRVPAAWVTLVLADRQLYPGVAGRDIPRTRSFCRHVVAQAAPLILSDTSASALPADDPAIAAYAGMPLLDAEGQVLGAMAAVDTAPRIWSTEDQEALHDLAATCSAELQLRIQISRTRTALAETESARQAAEIQRHQAREARSRSELASAVTQAMTSTFDPHGALLRLARMVVPLLADTCVIDLVEAEHVRQIALVHRDPTDDPSVRPESRPEPRPESRPEPKPEPMPPGDDPFARVLRGQNHLVRTEIPGREEWSDFGRARAGLLADLGARNAVTVALRARNRVLGALTFATAEAFAEEELALIDELAGRAALALDNIRLYQLQRHAAESLQQSMLTRLPEPAGLRLAARYAPASEGVDVGGDWYDAFCLPDAVTMVAVGDVAGHDLRAAGRMGQLRAMLRTLAYDRMDPPSVLLQRLDRALAGLGADTMATGVLAAIAPVENGWTLRWSNAGHLPPLLLHADGGSETLCSPTADLMLGVDIERPRNDRDRMLVSGDTLLLYTDGVVETRDTPPEQGLVRLRHQAARLAGGDIEQLCDGLIGDVAEHGGNDDAALIAVQLGTGG